MHKLHTPNFEVRNSGGSLKGISVGDLFLRSGVGMQFIE